MPSHEEMMEIHTIEEIENTQKIADACENYTILKNPDSPKFVCPNNMTEAEYLRQLAREGWKKKLKLDSEEQKKIYGDRAKMELDILSEYNLCGYVLIVWDYLNFAKQKGWLVGPGRGCFIPGTLVKQNNNKYITIEDIIPGDKVIDAYGNIQEVINVFEYNVDEEIIEIECENGVIVRCTKDHKFLTKNRGFVEAQYLTEEDDIVEI
jgi:DNA polymerase-3 subunit alpha